MTTSRRTNRRCANRHCCRSRTTSLSQAILQTGATRFWRCRCGRLRARHAMTRSSSALRAGTRVARRQRWHTGTRGFHAAARVEETSAAATPDKSAVVWLNEYFEPVVREGKRLNEMQVYIECQLSFAHDPNGLHVCVRAPFRNANRSEDFLVVVEEAIASPGFFLLQKPPPHLFRRELGELVLALRADERVEDILLNPDSSLWVKRFGERRMRFDHMPESRATSAPGTIAAWRGTVLNQERPFFKTELPLNHSRFEGIVATVVRRPVFAVGLHPRKIFSLKGYEPRGILTERDDMSNSSRTAWRDFAPAVRRMSHAEIIRAAVREKKNILIADAIGSGKTALANGILDELGRLASYDRVVAIEDTSEAQSSVANHVELKASGNVTMLDCLGACRRLHVRIVVGEVRGAETHTLLKAWNTGHRGGVATIHANDAMSALTRLESLVAEAMAAPQAGDEFKRVLASIAHSSICAIIDESALDGCPCHRRRRTGTESDRRADDPPQSQRPAHNQGASGRQVHSAGEPGHLFEAPYESIEPVSSQP